MLGLGSTSFELFGLSSTGFELVLQGRNFCGRLDVLVTELDKSLLESITVLKVMSSELSPWLYVKQTKGAHLPQLLDLHFFESIEGRVGGPRDGLPGWLTPPMGDWDTADHRGFLFTHDRCERFTNVSLVR